MKTITSWLFVWGILCWTLNLNAQNFGGENCADATPLGAIGGPESCPGGAGAEGEDTDLAEPAILNPSCDQFGANYDLWYSFVAPASGIIQLNVDLGSASRVESAVWSDCQTEVYCNSSNSNGAMIMGLMPGQVYYLQLWTDAFTRGTFDFCVFEKPGSPPNSECENPVGLNIINGQDPCASSGATPLLNNFGATPSGVAPTPSCGNFGMGIDVWYSIIVPASGDVSIEMIEAVGPQDWAFALYKGDCSDLTEIECDDDDGNQLKPRIDLTGRTPGEMLLLRVWEIGGDGFGSYRITVTEPSTTAPPNDLCAGAIDITNALQPNGGCSPICGHNVNSTPSGETPAPGCSIFGTGRDVWYKLTVPASGGVNIELDRFSTSGPQDWAMVAYTGTCGALTRVQCDDDSGPGLYPRLSLSGLTPGETVYIRIWEFQGDEEGPFNVCLTPRVPLALSEIQLSSVTQSNSSLLEWKVDNPNNLIELTLMKSVDEENWASIFQTKDPSTVSFVDSELDALSFYYVSAVQNDGRTIVSNMIAVDRENTGKHGLKAFPSPTRNLMNLSWDALIQQENCLVEILDLQGRRLYSQTMAPQGDAIQLNVGGFARGTYLVSVKTGAKRSVIKWVKE